MTKRIIALIFTFILLTSTAMAQTSDEPSNWAKGNVNKVEELGLATEETTKGYTQATNRQEFAALVVLLSEKVLEKEIEVPENNPFTDTEDVFIEKAYQAGIVKGIGGGLFAPNENVTREQIVVMYMNAMNMLEEELGRELIDEELSWDFDDEESFSFWAEDSIKIAGANGLVKGVGNNIFNPKGIATREQALVLSLRSFYFTEDVKEVLQKSKEYYKDVKSASLDSEIYLNMSMIEQDMPIEMEMLVNLDQEQVFEPYKSKMIINGEMIISMMDEEMSMPFNTEEYTVHEGEELISYAVSDDPTTGEKIYEKFVIPFQEQELEIFTQIDTLTDFESFANFRLVNKEVIDGKTIDTIVIMIDMDEEAIELFDGLIGDMLGEFGLDSSLLTMLNGIEFIYQFDDETGAIISIESDLGDYLNSLIDKIATLEGIPEDVKNLEIEINDFILKAEYTSVNEIEDIVIPQEVIDNAIDYTEASESLEE